MHTQDWKTIVAEHGDRVWRTAYRLLNHEADASDCLQEAFVCVLEISRRQTVKSYGALLIRVVTARAIDRLRERARRAKIQIEGLDPAEPLDAKNDPVRAVQDRELAEDLREALTRLPAQQAQAFCLRYFDDFSQRQVAEHLGVSSGTAGVILHRARARLRELLGQ